MKIQDNTFSPQSINPRISTSNESDLEDFPEKEFKRIIVSVFKKLEKKNNYVPEIVIPKGYEIDEILDTDEDDFGDEQPILTEEVKIRFER